MRKADPPRSLVTRQEATGPRAILRVPQVLLALATTRGGRSLAQLSGELQVPKTSLHRILRTLVRSGYLSFHGGIYQLDAASLNLAALITKSAPPDAFPGCARSTLEWLAATTRETVLLGVLSESKTEIIYLDVLDAEAPVRFTVPVGDRRPLYSSASGKAVLAFLPTDVQKAYLTRTKFTRFTSGTTLKSTMPTALRDIQKTAIAFDRGGKVEGATGIASPIFDRDGIVFASVSTAGPAERMESHRKAIEASVREAGERISRAMGYRAPYPATLMRNMTASLPTTGKDKGND